MFPAESAIVIPPLFLSVWVDVKTKIHLLNNVSIPFDKNGSKNGSKRGAISKTLLYIKLQLGSGSKNMWAFFCIESCIVDMYVQLNIRG